MTDRRSPSRASTSPDAAVDFPIFDAKTRSLKKAVLGRAGGRIGTDSKVPIIEALRDITVSLRRGDRVALVGHNGAGKSTLLRLMAGHLRAHPRPRRRAGQGRAGVRPRRSGWTRRSPGWTTSSSAGCSSGMTRKQMEARVDDIAAFTELGDYLSMPLRTYSTGMRVRLALGVVTSIDPEILLLDEGIGAVDAEFLAKARTRLFELVERSGILVFASHSDEFLADLCDTAIWLEHGTIREHGPLREVLHHYKGRDVLAEMGR